MSDADWLATHQVPPPTPPPPPMPPPATGVTGGKLVLGLSLNVSGGGGGDGVDETGSMIGVSVNGFVGLIIGTVLTGVTSSWKVFIVGGKLQRTGFDSNR